MDYLKEFSNEEIVKLFKEGKIGIKDIVDSAICPTCFNKENNNVLYGDNTDRMLYEDDLVECFLVGNPRSNGHTAISSKVHYKDMMEIPDELCEYVFKLAKKMMNIIKDVYKSREFNTFLNLNFRKPLKNGCFFVKFRNLLLSII